MNDVELSDQQLVAAFLGGDSAAFDVLVARYLKLVYSVIFHYVKDPQDAEDLAQDVFVKVLKNINRYDQSLPFKPWALRIARNHAIDWVKRKKPVLLSDFEMEEGENLLENIEDPTPLPDAIVQRDMAVKELQNVLQELSPKERLALHLRYIKGLSFNEIAQELHEAMETVKSRTRRALLKARKIAEKSKILA